MILHDAHHLAECYAVRLLAALLGAPLTLVPMDVYPGHDHRSDAFLAINPLGTLPVLVDGDAVITDWQAALAHLAALHAPVWLGSDTAALVGWLGMARDLAASLGRARLVDTFGAAGDAAALRRIADPLLDECERRVWFAERAGQMWLAGAGPTIADIAAFVMIAPAEDAGLSLRDRPALRRWCDRVRFLPGFIAVSGIFPPMANTPNVVGAT